MFGAGYAGAEDRLFLMDVLRHTGRARARLVRRRLQPRDGPHAVGARALHRGRPPVADRRRAEHLRRGRRAGGRDVNDYVAGHQRLHRRGQLDPTRSRPSTRARQAARTVEADRRDRHRVADRRHLRQGRRQRAPLGADPAGVHRSASGKKAGRKAWRDFRSKNDPEAPTTIAQALPVRDAHAFAKRGLALPDPGSSRDAPTATRSPAAPAPRRGVGGIGGQLLMRSPRAGHASNWELVSAKHSATGHPIARAWARRSATTCRRS